MSNPTHPTESHPDDNLSALLHEAEQALSSATGAADDQFNELRQRLRTAINHGKDSFAHLRTQAVLRARQTDELIRANPYYAIGVAAGVGALIGLLISRNRNGSR